MGLFKAEQREVLRIRKALSPLGYYACNIEKKLGHGEATINTIACAPGLHDEEIQANIQFLESLPDEVTREEYLCLSAGG
jgi:hypothetical protein